MAYLSLYRKYRSQSFEEVSGQEHVTRTLQNAIKGGRVAHAYLFCGPRGTGKTSTARLLAKALNCENLRGGEPCNECSACVQISEGRFMDMKEIDAASHRGIEEIRDLRDSVAYAPTQGKHKVYVIDEAHQITGDAFNAFLKTLEEPPPHVIFIMATTESHKIPATIVSRCQKFDFRRASLEQLKERVKYVAEQEGVHVQETALELIAREANGGWRDALSLLEQVLAFCEGEVTARDVYTVLGTVEAETLHGLAHAIFSQDGAELFKLLDDLISSGKDPRQLLRDVTLHYRSLMLAAAGSVPPGDPDFQSRMVEQARLYGSPRLLAAIEVLAHTEREARWSEQPRLLLEVALVRLMHPRGEPAPVRAAAPLAQTINRSPARETKPAWSAPEPRPQPRATAPEPSPFVDEPAPPAAVSFNQAVAGTELPPPPLTVGDARAGGGDDDEDLLGAFDDLEPASLSAAPVEETPRSAPEPAQPTAPEPAPVAPPAGELSAQLGLLRSKWRIISEELKRERKMTIHAALTDTVPDRFEADTLVIAFPNKTMAEMFSNRGKAFSDPLIAAIQRITGVQCRVRAEVGGKPFAGAATRKPEPSPAPAPPRPTAPAASNGAAGKPDPPRPSPPPAGSSGPGGSELIHNVLEVFDGQIVNDPEE